MIERRPTYVGDRRLSEWAYNVYSQNGEDGMIAELLVRLEISRGTCVEIGAHDGFTFSNTARLWHDRGWAAVLIEPHPIRYGQLVHRARGFDCVTLQRMVRSHGDDHIASLLQLAGFPERVDLLSVDIDGDDLQIVRNLAPVRARVMVVEYNPTIPFDIAIDGESGTPTGCSLGALVDAASELHYALVGVTRTNALFVDADDLDAVTDLQTDLAQLADRSCYTYIATDYRGRAAIIGPMPFRYRLGAPSFRPAGLSRRDVRVRWTARGIADAARWKTTSTLKVLGAMSPRELAGLIVRKLRRG